MNSSDVRPAALTEGDAARVEARPQPRAGAQPTRWAGGRIAALAIGMLLVLVSLAMLAAGGTGLWADRTQREAGYATSGVHNFSASGAALTTESTHLGAAGVQWLYAPGLLGKVRIRVTPASSGSTLFVGIGRTADVDRYLAGVRHTVISDFVGDKTRLVDGGPPGSVPGTQHFWAASSTGSGERTLVWKPSKGSWTVVVMNANARPGIDVGADLGARFPALLWIAVGFLVGGAVLMAGGVLLILGAIRSPVPAGESRRE
jgi:hypothetical protein